MEKNQSRCRATAVIILPNGQKKRLQVYGKTQKEADKKLARLQAEYATGVKTINCKTTFLRWAEQYMETYCKPKLQTSTYRNRLNMLKKYAFPAIGGMAVGEVKTAHIQAILSQFEGMSRDLASKVRQLLFNVFDKAILNDMIVKNPVTGTELPKATEKEVRRSLTDHERTVFFQVAQTHEKGVMFACQFACGLRSQEVRALKWQDIDFKNKTITVRQAVAAGEKITKAPKSAAGYRTIPIPEWYLPMLKTHIRDISTDFVFWGTGKQPITSQRFIRAWSSFLREMDIMAGAKLYRNAIIEHAIDQDITPYYLRHTYATGLAEKGVDIKTAQYLLGHSSIELTANIYTHVTSKMIETARNKINSSNSY